MLASALAIIPSFHGIVYLFFRHWPGPAAGLSPVCGAARLNSHLWFIIEMIWMSIGQGPLSWCISHGCISRLPMVNICHKRLDEFLVSFSVFSGCVREDWDCWSSVGASSLWEWHAAVKMGNWNNNNNNNMDEEALMMWLWVLLMNRKRLKVVALCRDRLEIWVNHLCYFLQWTLPHWLNRICKRMRSPPNPQHNCMNNFTV